MRSSEQCRVLFAVMVVLALVGVSCQGDDPLSSTEALPRAENQDLRVAVGEDPFLGGTPPTPNLGLRGDDLDPGIFETLTSLTPSFGLRPGLAERWEAESPTQWRFELREGVRFHDGTPLTADAVVETLRGAAGGLVNSERENVARRQSRPRGLEPESASAEGDSVVVVSLAEPNLRLAEQLAHPRMAVQAPGTQAGDGSSPAETATGTGPFRFASYTSDVELRVTANAEYWSGPPELTSITFRFGPNDDASRLLATRAVDLVGLVPAQDLAEVSGKSDRRLESPPGRSGFLLLNRGGVGEWATLQDEALRRALSLSLDRDAVAETVWPDHGEPNDTLIPPLVLSGEEVPVPERDVEGARSLLEGAGWVSGPDGVRAKEGERLALTLLVRNPDLVDDSLMETMAAQLREVGIALEAIGPGPGPGGGSPLERVNAATFDLFLDVRPQEDANPCALCRFFSIRPGGELTVSGVVGAGPEGDALFDQVHVAPSLAAARRVAADFMQVVIVDEVVAIPLTTLTNPWLASSRVQAFQPAAVAGAQQWASVYLSP